MNVIILILYTYALFSVSQERIMIIVDENNLNGTKSIEFEPLNTTLKTTDLIGYLDFEVKPCDNFYLFSCGKWIKTQKKIYEHSKNFSIGISDINFFKFLNEFYRGKSNDKSRTIKSLHNLLIKCFQQPKTFFEDCQSEILDYAKYAVTSVFLKNNKIKSEENGDYNIIEDMIKRIKEELRLLIDEKKDIFDEETRKHFLHKLNTMKFERNFDHFNLSNVELMEDCYESIGINYNDRIENIVETIKYFKTLSDNEKDDLKSCRGKIFQIHKTILQYVNGNAWYNTDENYFSINSDYLNEPSFSAYYPMSLNYGFLGYTIAHEILHAFDNKNYKYMPIGSNYFTKNATQFSIENYEEKSDCFVKQYDMQKESITNKNINGSLTLSENIPDNGGLKIAHRAYMKYLQNIDGKDLVVPGFENFTNEQLFFISAGRSECTYMDKSELENLIERDPHTPAEIRTNMALSNYKPFSNAFQCELNSKMNPENKCELWKN
uniref:Phosphate-regulating neutral endopeptidase (inferred by orthology to a human protein) n=1 Tax=Strongyloides venezuelensis TaxID=75913 RepID=A0A0K0FNH1_STRVS